LQQAFGVSLEEVYGFSQGC